MTNRLLIAVLFVQLLLLIGCQTAVQVNVDGADVIPPQIAGLWKSEKHAWQFLIEPDGTISKAKISLGGVDIQPGKTTRFDTRGGGHGEFTPGQWTLNYDADSRELSIEAVIDSFYQDLGNNAMKGNSTDLIVGFVTEDFTEWRADWFAKGTYIALMPEPNEIVSTNELDFRHELIFYKIEGQNDLIQDPLKFK